MGVLYIVDYLDLLKGCRLGRYGLKEKTREDRRTAIWSS